MFKKRIHILALLMLSAFLLSCYEQELKSPFTEKQFPLVKSTVLLEDEVNFPFRTLRYQNKLYVTDRSNEPSVSIFRFNEKNEVKQFKRLGREGRGGGEFLAPDQIIPKINGEGVFVYDAGGRKLVKINNQFEIESNDYSFRTSGMPTNIYLMTEDLFIVTGILPESRFEIYQKKEFELTRKKRIGDLTELGDRFGNLHLASAWRAQSVFHPELNRLVLFSSFADRIELFDMDGEILHTISNIENEVPKVGYSGSEFVFHNDAIISYVSATSNDEYLFALYSGNNYGATGSGNGTIIHVFDWELNFIKGYQLDHYSISISADNNGNIYSTQNHPEAAVRLINLNLDG
jgi:hypothetical protein